jgi:homogentisate 1,2-dioxygenase
MRKNHISFSKTAGKSSRQAHAQLPNGSFEREMGKEGFFGPSTHFYHKHPPTSWTKFEGDLKPHAFDFNKLDVETLSPWESKILLSNSHCRISYWQLKEKMPALARNADGDLLLFIHEGGGDFYCDFGHLTYRDGDYIVIPRSTMWRLEPQTPTAILMTEAVNDSFRLPDKGLLGPHALFDPAMLDTPDINDAFLKQQDENEWRVIVKRLGALTTITYPFNPLDAMGWKGDLSVVRINWRDIRPVISHRYHLPPSVHTTFVANRFVVCTFVPRPIESDPDALKLPFYHSNDDFDEFLFYHKGSFISRDNIYPGMATLHPNGFTHGPHPNAFAKAESKAGQMTDEVAVMIDTRDPLMLADAVKNVEWHGYVESWKIK